MATVIRHQHGAWGYVHFRGSTCNRQSNLTGNASGVGLGCRAARAVSGPVGRDARAISWSVVGPVRQPGAQPILLFSKHSRSDAYDEGFPCARMRGDRDARAGIEKAAPDRAEELLDCYFFAAPVG